MKSGKAHAFFILLAAALAAWSVTASAAEGSCKKGGIAHAIDAAYQDFHSFLQLYSGAPAGQLKDFLLDIDSYEVKAVAQGGKYIVEFTPFGYSGGVVKGAGAKYTIDKCMLKIEVVEGKQPIE